MPFLKRCVSKDNCNVCQESVQSKLWSFEGDKTFPDSDGNAKFTLTVGSLICPPCDTNRKQSATWKLLMRIQLHQVKQELIVC